MDSTIVEKPLSAKPMNYDNQTVIVKVYIGLYPY
jgi:hypothetical protein